MADGYFFLNGGKNNKHTTSNVNVSECFVDVCDVLSSQNNIKDLMRACGNGSCIGIYRCNSKRCQFQHDFQPSDKVVSTVTKRVYDCVVPPGTVYLNCHSSNLIYLITCSNCCLQYVGETVQKLNERFNFHKTGFRHPQKHGHCRILSEHFTIGKCKGAKYSVQILEKLETDGRGSHRGMDTQFTQLR